MLFNKPVLSVICPILAIAVLPPVTYAQSAASAADPDRETSVLKPIFESVLRYETVDQDGFSESADAVTFRVRAGFETPSFNQFKFLAEVEHVEDLQDDYNSTTNGQTQFPVIADPDGTELNRLQLTYEGLPDTKITLGRQRINLDDQRFVGAVGWRQDEQTYDAIRMENTSIENLKLDVTYIGQVNTIFGDDRPRGRRDSESVLLNAKYRPKLSTGSLGLTGFAYFLDFDDNPALSSKTFGVLANYKNGPLALKGSYASQSDYGSQPLSYDENYYLAEATYSFDGVSAGVGYEVLTGDGAIAFATPLATLHKFNGFDDQFLTTPADGLEDIYAKLSYKKKLKGAVKGFGLSAIYHDFSSDGASAFNREGNEIDLVGTLSFGKVKMLAKFADFSNDSLNRDREKFWLQVSYSY